MPLAKAKCGLAEPAPHMTLWQQSHFAILSTPVKNQSVLERFVNGEVEQGREFGIGQ
jgi:hypothetical protein